MGVCLFRPVHRTGLKTIHRQALARQSRQGFMAGEDEEAALPEMPQSWSN